MGLIKAERLRRRIEFTTLQRSGRRFFQPHLIFFSRPGRDNRRVGFTVSRRVGNAVVRNRTKRRLREIYRLNKDRFPGSLDLVIVARPGAADATFVELVVEVERCIQKLNRHSPASKG